VSSESCEGLSQWPFFRDFFFFPPDLFVHRVSGFKKKKEASPETGSLGGGDHRSSAHSGGYFPRPSVILRTFFSCCIAVLDIPGFYIDWTAFGGATTSWTGFIECLERQVSSSL
jgi:hypothetical protein